MRRASRSWERGEVVDGDVCEVWLLWREWGVVVGVFWAARHTGVDGWMGFTFGGSKWRQTARAAEARGLMAWGLSDDRGGGVRAATGCGLLVEDGGGGCGIGIGEGGGDSMYMYVCERGRER